MWEYEHSIETEASYRLYSDVATWPRWGEGISQVTLDGPFAVGTHGFLTPKGQGPLAFRVAEVRPNEGFADETEMPEAGIAHSLVPLTDGRTRITHHVTITGPAADALEPQIGSAVTAGIPDTMASLARHALQPW